MNKRLLGVSVSAALFLSACSALPSETEPEPEETVAAPAPAAEPEPAETGMQTHQWVQDFWVYESIAKISDTGEAVELTQDIMDHLETSDGLTHDLPGSATFTVYPELDARILGADAQARGDIEVLAGVLRTPDVSGFAVLGTPAPDAGEPIGLEDVVDFDLTFLTDLEPGDVLSADIAFLQALAEPAPSDLDSVGLLAYRLENRQTQHFGADGVVGVFPMQLGQAVAGSIRGQLPAKSDPMMGGFDEGLEGCKGDLKCVSDFFQSFGEGVSGSWDLIKCNLSATCGVPPAKPAEPAQCWPGVKGGGCGEVSGDPHIRTTDGRYMNMQAVGEFLGLSSEEFELQFRTHPWNDSRTVSLLTAVAIRAGQTTIMVDTHEGELRLRVNGTRVPFEVESVFEHSEASITAFPGALEITTQHGDHATIWLAGRAHLSLNVGIEDLTGMTGLIAGTGLAEEYDAREFYDDFVNSWRLSDETSLFTYADGEGTSDHTDLSFPDEIVTLDSLPAADRARAEAICTASGIESPAIIEQCIFDFAVTSSAEFVRAAQAADARAQRAENNAEAGTTKPVAEVEGWHATAHGYEIGDIVRYTCPADGTHSRAWGGDNGIYTDDSTVCSAAVHHGSITRERGGIVTIEITPGLETYGFGSTRNGVTTREWDSPWSGSFVIRSAVSL